VSEIIADIRTLQGSRAADWLRISSDSWPDRICYATDHTSYTFAETNSRVNRLATSLRELGIGKGDRVALFATDSTQYMEIILACMKLGAVYVPLNFRLARPELETLLRASEARVLFFSDRYAEMVHAVDAPALETRVGIDSLAGDTTHDALIGAGLDQEIDTPMLDHELMCIAFTSGTTSLPKGVMHSQRMVKHMVNQCIVDGRMTSITFHYSAAPLFHVGGLLYTLAGVARSHSSLVLPAFDPETILRWMASGRLDGVFLVPTMIDTLLQQPGVESMDFSRIRSIRYGAAPMSPTLLRRVLDRFPSDCELMNLFGAGTEAGLQTSLTPEDHRRALEGHEHLLGSIGKPGVGVVLRICDDELNDVAQGEVGEIVTRSDAVMSGYLDQPEETGKVLVDGWFRGGDMAWRDAEGYLYLSGRKRDMIIRGGENIYPIEIEHILSLHPSVREVAVVGVPDDHWGELVRAHVVLEPGAGFDEDEVRAYCREQLAGYKVPALFQVHDELPRNASGKILKRELRKS
jgi:acyl-CoA synthetase (AMP-forming)/AMP-acid ligase II